MVVMATSTTQLMSEVCRDIKKETSPSSWNLDVQLGDKANLLK